MNRSVDIHAYPQTNYISVTFVWHCYSLWTPSGNICRNFRSHYWRGWVEDVPDATRSTGAVRMLQITCRLHMDQLRILITPGIRKPFKENSSSLIFLWRPHRHFTSLEDATRMLQLVRTCSWMKNMMYMTHSFPYLATCHDPAVHPAMCNWGLRDVLLLSANSQVGTFPVVPCTNLRG